MEFMLVLFEDPDLVATDEQRKEAVERVGEYAMGLLSDGALRGGAPLHPGTEAKRIRTRDRERRRRGGPARAAQEGRVAPLRGSGDVPHATRTRCRASAGP